MSAMSGAGGWMLALSALEDIVRFSEVEYQQLKFDSTARKDVATRQSIDVISINAALSAAGLSDRGVFSASVIQRRSIS